MLIGVMPTATGKTQHMSSQRPPLHRRFYLAKFISNGARGKLPQIPGQNHHGPVQLIGSSGGSTGALNAADDSGQAGIGDSGNKSSYCQGNQDFNQGETAL